MKGILTILLWLLIIFTTSITFAQSSQYPYELDLRNDLIISGISLLTFTSGILVGEKDHDESQIYFNKLNRNDVNSFDRTATNNWNEDSEALRENLADIGIFGVGLIGSLGLTTYVSLNQNEPGSTVYNLLSTNVMFFEGIFLVLGVSDLSKAAIDRPRPYSYNDDVSYEDKISEEDYKESFFSGTSAITAYGTFFTAKLFSDMFPKSNWKYACWAAAGIYTSYTSWLAVDAGQHFPTDVLVGSLIGMRTAILFPHLHKKQYNENNIISYQLSPTAEGIKGGVTLHFGNSQ